MQRHGARKKGSHAGAMQTGHAGEGWPTSLDSRVLGHAQGNGPVGLLQNGPTFGSRIGPSNGPAKEGSWARTLGPKNKRELIIKTNIYKK